MGSQSDRRVRPREAEGEGSRAVRGSRSADADPPAVLRPDRPAADAGGGRRVRRTIPTRRLTRSSSTACSPRPRYGERWARHWLDVVHYGDTHGYDKDKVRDQRLALPRLRHPRVQRRQAVRPLRAGAARRRRALPRHRRTASSPSASSRPGRGISSARSKLREGTIDEGAPQPRPRRHGRHHDEHVRAA